MSSVEQILVATDGSEHSIRAATLAGNLARGLDASVTVLLVQDERYVVAEAWNAAAGPAASESRAGSVEEARQSMEQSARSEEIARTTQAVGDVPVGLKQVQIWGHPADAICRYAKDHDVDLIVMGSHGRSGLMRAVLGSVSHSVVNTAPCAVTIVR